jgi:hypothetical protein
LRGGRYEALSSHGEDGGGGGGLDGAAGEEEEGGEVGGVQGGVGGANELNFGHVFKLRRMRGGG